MSNKEDIHFEGSNYFRTRFVLSCLSGKPIKIQNIRHLEDEPGVKDFEVSFIRLIDRITNGSKIVVSETGTEVKFRPGILYGGHIEHTCPPSRSIGYYLETLILLAPFCKQPLNITFRGVTNNKIDPSVDAIQYSMISVLKKLLVVDEGLSLKIEKRGLPPDGGGVVRFTCPIRKSLKAFQWEKYGKIQKIRGVAFTSRVSPSVSNRVMEASKSVLKNFLSDIYFTCDNSKGLSPGFGITLAAKTNDGSVLTAEGLVCKSDVNDMDLPEELGKKVAFSLLEEVYDGGCVDSLSQPLLLCFMVLSPKDVSRVVLGPISPYTMNFMKHVKNFFGIQFKIDPYPGDSSSIDEEEDLKMGARKLLISCVGVGYTNISKPQL